MMRRKISRTRTNRLTKRENLGKSGTTSEKPRLTTRKKNIHQDDFSGFEFPMSTGEVARMLNIHTNTVRRWSRTGILKTFRVGPRGDRRFMPRDVQRLLQKTA
jgi:excisionase family DNA binding protein